MVNWMNNGNENGMNIHSDDDIVSWMERYKRRTNKLEWDEEKKVDSMRIYLAGKAADFYDKIIKNKLLSFKNLKQQLIKNFIGQEYMVLQRNIQQGHLEINIIN